MAAGSSSKGVLALQMQGGVPATAVVDCIVRYCTRWTCAGERLRRAVSGEFDRWNRDGGQALFGADGTGVCGEGPSGGELGWEVTGLTS